MTGWKEWYDQHGEDNQLESWDDVWQEVFALMSANEEEGESNGTTPTPILDPPKDDIPF